MRARPLAAAGWLLALPLFLSVAAQPTFAAPQAAPEADDSAGASEGSSEGASAGDAERGRVIYERGLTADGGVIEAAFGDEGFTVEASVLPCASCHGYDGKGRPEGGISPSDLTWQSLTHPRGSRNQAGREHPPYDQRSVLRAVTMGVDPAGNALNTTMPRYHLAHRDAADLIAYLRQLELRKDPGIEDDALVVATLLPPGSSQAAAVASALGAFFEELNQRGGVYGRRLRLRVLDLPAATASPEARAAELRESLKDAGPFVLVAPDMSRREAALADLFAAERLPVIGPFALQPRLELPPNRYVFYLFGGVEEQARALLDFAAEKHAETVETPAEVPVAGRLLIVAPAGGEDSEDSTTAWIDSARDQARLGAWSEVLTPALAELYGAELVAGEGSASPQDADTVLFLGGGEDLSRLLRALDRAGRYPEILVPGSFAGAAMLSAPAGFENRLYLAFPVLPSDTRQERLDEFWQLAENHGLEKRHLAAQLSALAAAQVLVEALSRAGSELSREALIEALETLYEHPTGLVPALTFNANRRLGARGVHIVRADLASRQFEPTGHRVTPR